MALRVPCWYESGALQAHPRNANNCGDVVASHKVKCGCCAEVQTLQGTQCPCAIGQSRQRVLTRRIFNHIFVVLGFKVKAWRRNRVAFAELTHPVLAENCNKRCANDTLVCATGTLCGCQCIMPYLVEFDVVAFGVQCCLGNAQCDFCGEIDCIQLM